MVEAIQAGRGTSRFSKNKDHATRLDTLAKNPTPANALAWLEGVLQHRECWLYRRECAFQLRAALRECLHGPLTALPDAVAAARTRARHRGRQTHLRTIRTPLLVKGLEFDHAVVLWEPEKFSLEGLYVAITRGAKSLTIVRVRAPSSRRGHDPSSRLSPCSPRVPAHVAPLDNHPICTLCYEGHSATTSPAGNHRSLAGMLVAGIARKYSEP